MCSAQDMGCADGRDACGQYIPRIVRADSRFRNSCGPAIRCSRIPCSRIPCSSVGTAWPRSRWFLEQGCSRSGRRCRPRACRESHRGLLRLHWSVWCPVLAAPYRLRHRCHARSGHGTADRHGTHYAAQSQSRPPVFHWPASRPQPLSGERAALGAMGACGGDRWHGCSCTFPTQAASRPGTMAGRQPPPWNAGQGGARR